jgi:hypothetical protein
MKMKGDEMGCCPVGGMFLKHYNSFGKEFFRLEFSVVREFPQEISPLGRQIVQVSAV